MAKMKAILKQVWLENISEFKEEQTVNFKTGNTFTFIGKIESGTAGFNEAIRRCCETDINHSFSCAYDEKSPSIVVCTFEREIEDVEENENTLNIDSKDDSTTKSSIVEESEWREYTHSEANDKDVGKSNVIVHSIIPQRAEEIQKTNLESTKEMAAHSGEIAANTNVDGGSTKSQTLVSIYIQRKVNNSTQEALKVLVLRKGNTYSSESIVLSIIKDKPTLLMRHQPSAKLDENDCKKILNGNLKTVIKVVDKLMDGERDDLKTGENKFDNLFHEFVDIEFLFLYRVTTLQSSEQIKTSQPEVNYKKASSDGYVLHDFIKNRNRKESCYDKELEEKIFERLNIHKDVDFEYDEQKEFLYVVIGNFKYSILKAPEEILAAKYLSITLSKRKAILIIAEPGRDMHLAMIRRMVNLVFQDKEMLGGAMVILTTNSKDFLTPINLENTFIVMKNVDDGSIIRQAKPDKENEGKEYSCDILSMLVVCDRILFVEGKSDYTFVDAIIHSLVNNKDLTDAYLKALQEELKGLSLKQLMSFLLSLNIKQMDGCTSMRNINNACEYLEMDHKRYFLLDFDTIRHIHKSIELPDRTSFSLDTLEQRDIFVWDDDLVQTSEPVEDTPTSDKGKQCTGTPVKSEEKSGKMIKPGTLEKGTQCTGTPVKSEENGGKVIKPGTLEDVIVRFSIHHDLLYHAEPGQCNVKSCNGLVNLLGENKMVSYNPWSTFEFIIEKKGTDKRKGGKHTFERKHEKLCMPNKFLLAQNLTHKAKLTIVNRYLECSISNREGQIWRFLKFIGAKAFETHPAKSDNTKIQGHDQNAQP